MTQMTDEEPEQPQLEAAYEPTEEELEDRRQRANRATRGALAGLLCLEAFCVLLVPRTIAQTSVGLATWSTITLIAYAVVLVAIGFMLRRPWGIGVASALHIGMVLIIALVPLFAIVTIIFLLLWYYMIKTRHELVGTAAG